MSKRFRILYIFIFKNIKFDFSLFNCQTRGNSCYFDGMICIVNSIDFLYFIFLLINLKYFINFVYQITALCSPLLLIYYDLSCRLFLWRQLYVIKTCQSLMDSKSIGWSSIQLYRFTKCPMEVGSLIVMHGHMDFMDK